MSNSVNDVLEMARALSQGNFDQQFQQDFQGELGQLAAYLEAVRQTLQSLSSSAKGSTELIPKAADGVAEINHEAESSFNSVWDVIERIQADQAVARELLSTAGSGLPADVAAKLRAIADKHHQELLALMSYLSFQDVLRQRLEKIQAIIGQVEDKTLELMHKFKSKSHEQSPGEQAGAGNATTTDLDQNLVDRLMMTLR